uniref:response regulator transcription factor n=1 Tax=Roseivirga sp. TaxID=1964215 RepID=UPI00404747AC
MAFGKFRETRKTIENKLSTREMEVLQALAHGYSRKAISEKLSISVLTYDEHRKNIKIKLGLDSQADWASALVLFRQIRVDKTI